MTAARKFAAGLAEITSLAVFLGMYSAKITVIFTWLTVSLIDTPSLISWGFLLIVVVFVAFNRSALLPAAEVDCDVLLICVAVCSVRHVWVPLTFYGIFAFSVRCVPFWRRRRML